jgi:hypothetical protein
MMKGVLTHSAQILTLQVPTQATNLEPVFIFNFEIDEMLPPQSSRVKVILNPSLNENKSMDENERYYSFDENGQCKICHQEENHYFVKGDLKLKCIHEGENDSTYNCLANMTYGNKEKELHYIKGVFKLTKMKETVICR